MSLHDEAAATLRGWTAPDSEQERLRSAYVGHLDAHPDGEQRACFPAHLTAGAADQPRRSQRRPPGRQQIVNH